MIISEENILTVIPQRPPFVMIGHLETCATGYTKTITRINDTNVLVEKGFFTEAGLTENIAQTAAAGAGYWALMEDKPVKTGYIGTIKNLEIFKLPQAGDLIETEVVVENEIFDVTVIAGNVKCNGILLAKCEMKIFIQN